MLEDRKREHRSINVDEEKERLLAEARTIGKRRAGLAERATVRRC